MKLRTSEKKSIDCNAVGGNFQCKENGLRNYGSLWENSKINCCFCVLKVLIPDH
jgi:hypothetical protein